MNKLLILATIRNINRTAFQFNKFQRYFSAANPEKSASDETKAVNENKPIQFYGSPAATWKAKSTRSGKENADETPWFQTYVISASLVVFLTYFCVLREESDVDMKLEERLYDRVKGLEETQLILAYKYNLENGQDVTDIRNRLQELGVEFK